MKLDKIFIDPMPNPSDGYVGIAWLDAHGEAVEYIRKDTLLEWLESKIKIPDVSFINGLTYLAYKDVIDKLNEM